ncbi:uncharacterized protein NECHADRAFT_97942 [Fusarium vanettenii 77-13-4]|uniref:Uncharacterized protein n=1 Tax=Fusarium vanettenii (strain ATCC MYA-4622 / CBS 123669 / FGSC 9596 / NRRL 45880 / 77-13-4) TaxID=660122 RepID=C7ZL55_FUSV7|nr:uncharacterized protein NECHADRAFT_97942 [Fusarium vanettenii 77-13-4]EEU35256.1 hypothetical protein NECHADRAFT_97942 [Fusarium vanettenii 77-13-4]
MPFDFKAYDEKCRGLNLEELQREWEHYTRLISGAATSTAVSGMAIPLTLGVSTIGVAMAAPAIHNARKKREIIERHLNRLQATHHTRKRDVLGSMAVSGTIGVVTLGVGSMGADAVATAGAEHGIQSIVANETAIKIATHAALDGAGMAIEHKHTDRLKKKDALKAFKKAGVFKAVQDAKAAEAGYSIQPYNQQGYPYAAAGSSSQAPLIPPPPPYTPADGQTPAPPSYALNANGYPQDFKAPMAYTPAPQGQQYMIPDATGQQPASQYYGYPPQPGVPQQQANSPTSNQSPTSSKFLVNRRRSNESFLPSKSPSSIKPSLNSRFNRLPLYNRLSLSNNSQVLSPPQTPAVGYPPQVVQAQQNIQSPAISQPQPHEQPGYFTQTTANPPNNPAPSTQMYDMSGIKGALPAQTPAPTGSSYQPPPPQQYSVAPLPTPAQEQPQNYTYLPAQTPQPAVAGYPPPISLPPQPTPQPATAQAASVSATPQAVPTLQTPSVEYQQPAAPAPQAQYYPQATYQHTGTYQQAQVPPPPPQEDPNRRASMISTPQHPLAPHPTYNPQHYQPASHQQAKHQHHIKQRNIRLLLL